MPQTKPAHSLLLALCLSPLPGIAAARSGYPNKPVRMIVPLENLALSPQCGFSSTHHGNLLGIDDQKRKRAQVVEVANEVWGTA